MAKTYPQPRISLDSKLLNLLSQQIFQTHYPLHLQKGATAKSYKRISLALNQGNENSNSDESPDLAHVVWCKVIDCSNATLNFMNGITDPKAWFSHINEYLNSLCVCALCDVLTIWSNTSKKSLDLDPVKVSCCGLHFTLIKRWWIKPNNNKMLLLARVIRLSDELNQTTIKTKRWLILAFAKPR